MLLTTHAVMLETGMQVAHQVFCWYFLLAHAKHARLISRAHANLVGGHLMCILRPARHLLQDIKHVLPDESLSRCSSVCHVDYTLQQQQQQQQQVVCETKYIGLGASMACIVATSNGSRITTLNVSLVHHLKSQQQQLGNSL